MLGSDYTAAARSKFQQTRGFTIIELLIATVVFSVVLLVFLAAFLQISRLFYKGVSMNNTQESARNVVQDISDDLKFTSSAPPANFTAQVSAPAPGYFCIGLHRYKYNLGYQLGSTGGSTNYGILRENVSSVSCPDPSVTGSGSNPQEILDNGMQLNALSLNCAIGRCIINVHVIFYGGTPGGLFATDTTKYPSFASTPWLAPDALCTGSLNSSQYCAVADYNSTVIPR